MSNKPEEIIRNIKQFIEQYMEHSQKRGRMYGSIRELESNWILLDHVSFILNSLEERWDEMNFATFLCSKGFGAKSASQFIEEEKSQEPYLALNNLWNEYIKWRTPNITK